jgi:hypothetical protein
MDFLKHKFFDSANLIEERLLTPTGALKQLEELPEDERKHFRDNFFRGLKTIETVGFKEETYNVVDEATNPWSIDFPSWIGPFDPKSGKKVFVIGSEPHIHHTYLQTVYGFHTANTETLIKDSSSRYFETGQPIFRFIPHLLSSFLDVSEQEVLENCYLTDLVPFAPKRSRDKNLGSTNSINNLIKGTDDWRRIRRAYATNALASEILAVKPEIIVTQGKEVFYEVCQVLLGSGFEVGHFPIKKIKGKQQYVRISKWGTIPILSVPHIGSKRMRTFWGAHIEEAKCTVTECLNIMI